MSHPGDTTDGTTGSKTVSVDPRTLPRIATVDERYQSYNVEMAEVVGGNFWKPYDRNAIAEHRKAPRPTATGGTAPQVVGEDTSIYQKRPPIDLTNARLRRLAAALGPSYMRTSGTWANTIYFHDSDTPAPEMPPRGFQGVLSRQQWKGVIDFAHAANARLVTSFAVSEGVRDASGVWTPVQARKFIAYTKSAGGHIAGAEFFNEPDMPVYGGAPKGYTAHDYARDFAVFRSFAKTAAPDMLIVGPGSVGEGVLMPLMGAGGEAAIGYVSTADMLSATPRPMYDVFSYHFYGSASIRCASMGAAAQTTPDSALSEAWLARTDRSYAYYIDLRDRFEPNSKGVWITETADAACGGNPWAATFLDSFRYLDQMGRLAKTGVTVIFHNTLASSEYGLLDQNTFTPRPNYWAALLWHRLMGTTVLDAGPSRAGLHLYAHCMRGHAGGVTLLAINNSRTQPSSLDVPTAAERYTLTAPQLEAATVQLNGHHLRLGPNDALPTLQGANVPAGTVTLAPTSITFFTIAGAANRGCK